MLRRWKRAFLKMRERLPPRSSVAAHRNTAGAVIQHPQQAWAPITAIPPILAQADSTERIWQLIYCSAGECRTETPSPSWQRGCCPVCAAAPALGLLTWATSLQCRDHEPTREDWPKWQNRTTTQGNCSPSSGMAISWAMAPQVPRPRTLSLTPAQPVRSKTSPSAGRPLPSGSYHW